MNGNNRTVPASFHRICCPCLAFICSRFATTDSPWPCLRMWTVSELREFEGLRQKTHLHPTNTTANKLPAKVSSLWGTLDQSFRWLCYLCSIQSSMVHSSAYFRIFLVFSINPGFLQASKKNNSRVFKDY